MHSVANRSVQVSRVQASDFSQKKVESKHSQTTQGAGLNFALLKSPLKLLVFLLAASSTVGGADPQHGSLRGARQLTASADLCGLSYLPDGKSPDFKNTWQGHSLVSINSTLPTLQGYADSLLANNPTVITTMANSLVSSSDLSSSYKQVLSDLSVQLNVTNAGNGTEPIALSQALTTVLTASPYSLLEGSSSFVRVVSDVLTSILIRANDFRTDGISLDAKSSIGLPVTLGNIQNASLTGSYTTGYNGDSVPFPAGAWLSTNIYPEGCSIPSTVTMNGLGLPLVAGRSLAFAPISSSLADSTIVPVAGELNGYATSYNMSTATTGLLNAWSGSQVSATFVYTESQYGLGLAKCDFVLPESLGSLPVRLQGTTANAVTTMPATYQFLATGSLSPLPLIKVAQERVLSMGNNRADGAYGTVLVQGAHNLTKTEEDLSFYLNLNPGSCGLDTLAITSLKLVSTCQVVSTLEYPHTHSFSESYVRSDVNFYTSISEGDQKTYLEVKKSDTTEPHLVQVSNNAVVLDNYKIKLPSGETMKITYSSEQGADCKAVIDVPLIEMTTLVLISAALFTTFFCILYCCCCNILPAARDGYSIIDAIAKGINYLHHKQQTQETIQQHSDSIERLTNDLASVANGEGLHAHNEDDAGMDLTVPSLVQRLLSWFPINKNPYAPV